MRVIAYRPLFQPLNLVNGLDPRTDQYQTLLKSLKPQSKKYGFDIPFVEHSERETSYEDLEHDDYDLRLLIWTSPADKGGNFVRYHIYTNQIMIAEVHLLDLKISAADVLNKAIVSRTLALMEEHQSTLTDILKSCVTTHTQTCLKYEPDKNPDVLNSINWISRALVFSDKEIKTKAVGSLLEAWLKDTLRPEDAQALVTGEIDYSLTWVNYAIVERDKVDTRLLLAAMRIAQYFYAAQEQLNAQTLSAISRAYVTDRIRSAEKILTNAKSEMLLLRIQFDIQNNLLNVNKRKAMMEILEGWDYARLVVNGERMVTASDSRINEINNLRVGKSSLITDMILVSIAFLTIIDLALSLTEYSREVMSRPALSYTDASPSWVLGMIASVDADVMIIGGCVSILALIVFYAFWKHRN